MRYKTKTTVIIFGLFSILSLIIAIDGFKNKDFGSIFIGAIGFILFAFFFITFLKMMGNIYLENNKIINENIFGKNINSIDQNISIKFGIYSIAINNEHKMFLDKENDTNNIMESIYNYIRNDIQNKTIIFPYLYKRDNYIISILFFIFAIIGVLIYISIYINIFLLLLSLILFLVSVITFIPNRGIIINNENIIIYNFLNQKKIISNTGIYKINLLVVGKRLALYIFSKNKKIIIPLNNRVKKQNIENIYLLEKYYKEIVENNGHST